MTLPRTDPTSAAGPVTLEFHGSVAVIALDKPPVNGIGISVRSGILSALAEASEQSAQAVVIQGVGRGFSGGADVQEFGQPASRAEPLLPAVITQIEGSSVPVIAAMHGYALGGGLELALGCHYRIAQRGTRMGLPETGIGILPGAGGTQRLPRLVDLGTAIDIVVHGRELNAEQALAAGLVDEVFSGAVLDAAVRFAHSLATGPQRRLNEAPVSGDPAVIQDARDRLDLGAPNLRAQRAALDCFEVVLTTPLTEGLAEERSRFEELAASPESHALRHIAFAERRAARPSDPSGTAPGFDRTVVVGAGTMGTGIAVALLRSGASVTLLERDPESLERGLATIRETLFRAELRGDVTVAQRSEHLLRLRGATEFANAAGAELVIEAVFEELAVKRAVFAELCTHVGEETLLASNTSRLDIAEIADGLAHPERVIGTHFFSPAHRMPLLEIVRGRNTGEHAVLRALALAAQLGKKPVVVNSAEGFAGNRMLTPYWREAWSLIEEGASPTQVDRAMTDYGLAMGPLAMADLAGLDINWAARKRLAPQRDPRHRYPRLADRLCELGRFGQKTGAGFYQYAAGSRVPEPDPVVTAIAEQCAGEVGVTRRTIPDAEIVERCLLALVNEGAKVLEEGVAQRASDLDVVYVNGYGFPAWRGGPMYAAEQLGLESVLERVRALETQHGAQWAPAGFLVGLVTSGATEFPRESAHGAPSTPREVNR